MVQLTILRNCLRGLLLFRGISRLELNFLQWHSQAVRDFETLPALMNPVALKAATKRSFQVDLRDDHLRTLGLASAAPAIIVTPSAPRGSDLVAVPPLGER